MREGISGAKGRKPVYLKLPLTSFDFAVSFGPWRLCGKNFFGGSPSSDKKGDSPKRVPARAEQKRRAFAGKFVHADSAEQTEHRFGLRKGRRSARGENFLIVRSVGVGSLFASDRRGRVRRIDGNDGDHVRRESSDRAGRAVADRLDLIARREQILAAVRAAGLFDGVAESVFFERRKSVENARIGHRGAVADESAEAQRRHRSLFRLAHGFAAPADAGSADVENRLDLRRFHFDGSSDFFMVVHDDGLGRSGAADGLRRLRRGDGTLRERGIPARRRGKALLLRVSRGNGSARNADVPEQHERELRL